MWSTFIEYTELSAETLGDLTAQLTAAVAEATTRWPQLVHPNFVALLGQRCGVAHRASVSPAVWFERLHPADLYLTTACTERIPGAADLFEATYRDDLRRTVRRFEDSRHLADDLMQIVLQRMLASTTLSVGDREGEVRGPKLGEYAGQGPLQGWLRVVASRLCIDAVKGGVQHRREHGTEANDLAAADLSDDVELGFIKASYRAQFKVAFAEATARLEHSERSLLKMSVLRGLSIDEIGSVFHIHRSTAARRIERARQHLLDYTREALAETLSVGEEELDSIIGLIHSRLEVSLERLLETNRDL